MNDEELVARIREVLAKAENGDLAANLAAIEDLMSLGDPRVQQIVVDALRPLGRPKVRTSRAPVRAAKVPLQVYQIKVTLKGVKPPIWRRIQVRNDITLPRLHQVLQLLMGWKDYHLHEFTVRGVDYGEPDPDGMSDDDTVNEKRVKLGAIVAGAKEKFLYTYDFGDNWELNLVVEKVEEPKEGVSYPVCLAGKRAGPPEDCGGPWGYTELLEIVSNPEHPEYAERREWLGEDFDPEYFDLEEINKALQKLR